jgi:Thymidylate synthase
MLQIFNTGISYSDIIKLLKLRLSMIQPIEIGEWHSQPVSHPLQQFHELHNVIMEFRIPPTIEEMQKQFEPNLPWADDHFEERVSGFPHNPPPSAERWPFARNQHSQHLDYHSQFSHSYPERFYPKHAGHAYTTDDGNEINHGVRFPYGDLDDLIALLARKPFTRQAFLPVWFPEDTGNAMDVRVPCTLGYHFQIRAHSNSNGLYLNCTYTIRSCDLYRHMNDDVYMAARLMEAVRLRVNYLHDPAGQPMCYLGNLVVHIMNLHVFAGDMVKLNQELRQAGIKE